MRFIIGTFLCLLIYSAMAENAVVPADLDSWKEWILQDHEQFACPSSHVRFSDKRCTWPSELTLSVSDEGAEFNQRWVVYGNSWVKLLGDQKLWPAEITVNGKSHPIGQFQKTPAIYLTPGEYSVSGKIPWSKRPQYMPIPSDTALIALSVDDAEIATPSVENGRLWLSKQSTTQRELFGDALSVDIFRRLSDTIPFTITTEMHLKVSGRDRELLLGRMLMSGMVVESLSSPLPARLEDDGRIRVQVRPGNWQINLKSRAVIPPTEFSMQALDPDWPAQEIWSFDAQRQLRVVEWKGGTPGDPIQLSVPQQWSRLPAYIVTKSDTVRIHERYRGDADSTPNQLTLHRELWLDFNGDSFTVRDQINGELHRADRFSMAQGYHLGRASLNGQPQLITALDDKQPGVEIPAGTLQIEAISRFPRTNEPMSAVGWQHDISKVSAVLNLPPGWRLLHSTEVDHVDQSWLSQWSLWDLFLCLVIAGAAARVLGMPWGILAGVTLILTYHESEAPVLLWINVILALALLKAIPQNTFSKLLRYYQRLSLLALVLVVLDFSVDQVRKGLYPQLDRNAAIISDHYGTRVEQDYSANKVAEPEMAASMDQFSTAPQEMKSRKKSLQTIQSLPKYDPGAQIQTGPGLPKWQWHQVRLNWSGPVLDGQATAFYLLPPGAMRVWRIFSVIFVGLWLLGLIRQSISTSNIKLRKIGNRSIAILLAPLILFNAPDNQADYPPEHLLKQYEQRLTSAPECMPHCASLRRVALSINNQDMRIDMTLDALANVQLPLPAGNWWQAGVIHNGEPAVALSRNPQGRLLIALPKGSHNVTLVGRLNNDNASISFPMPVHNASMTADGWQTSGLIDGSVPSGTLQLDREPMHREVKANEISLLPNPVAPFVLIHRQLTLNLDWSVTTTVTRIAPRHGAINMKIPLLDGESILSTGVEIEDGNAQISMPATANVVRWSSSLKQSDVIHLDSKNYSQWAEQWQVNHSSIWHVRFEGINPVKASTATAPQWRPWPNEQLAIYIQRPGSVEGPSQTVERLLIDHRPGAHASETELTVQIRASLGGNYPLTLPKGAELQSVSIDGQPQILQLEESQIQLPLHPGTVDATINWRMPQSDSTVLETPALALPSKASNINLRLQLPSNRWPLFVAGPDIGPAMLFWGVLIVILIVSGALGWSVKRFKLDVPVRPYQWMLLGLGVSTVSVAGGIFIVLWFAALSARQGLVETTVRWKFNLTQVGLIVLTLAALGSLVATIPFSLLSTPDMQVVGNHSNNFQYNWYQDHSSEQIPQGWVFSLPIYVYRGVMLAWSLWLMLALLDWVKWGWACFSTNGLWKQKSKVAINSNEQ